MRPKRRGFRPVLLLLALGITACLVAWGYLVYVAIDFGSAARRDGDSAAWGLLVLAGVGAVACLFLGFMLIARLARAFTEPSAPPEAPPGPPPPTRPAAPAPPSVPMPPRGPARPPARPRPTTPRKPPSAAPRGRPKKQKGGKRAAR
jgi:hypothetical protein